MPTLADRFGLVLLRAQGFRSAHVHTALGRVHVLRARGRGPLPPVLLMHGLGARGAQYAFLARRLLPHVQGVVLPDAPGHGLSDPPPDVDPDTLMEGLIAALDQIQDTPWLVFGNSLGGFTAMRYAVNRPERVAGLVVNSPAGAPTSPAGSVELKKLFTPDNHEEALALVRRAFPRRRYTLPLLARLAYAQMRNAGVRQLIQRMEERHALTPEELGRLPARTLLLWGDHERVMLAEQLAFFQQHLPPHVVLERPALFGHSPHLDDAEALAQRLLAFARAHWGQGEGT